MTWNKNVTINKHMRAKNGLLCSEKGTFQNINNTFSIEYQIILVCTHMAFYDLFSKQIEELLEMHKSINQFSICMKNISI